MKAALTLRATHTLTLTPQLQLAIRLLRLSSQELVEEMREAALSNPLLELEEPGPSAADGERIDAARVEDDGAPDRLAEQPAGEPVSEDFDESTMDEATMDLELMGRWDESFALADPDEQETREPPLVLDLKQHLLAQVACLDLDDMERAIAAALIDALDDDGYLREDPATVREALGLPHLPLARIESVRARLLDLEPTGVGSRSLSECLMAQLAEYPETTPGLGLARRLIVEHTELLAVSGDRIAAALGLDPAECQAARALVAALDPRPGARFHKGPPGQVIPDFEVYRQRGRWRVRLVNEAMPRLKLATVYASLARSHNRAEASWIQARLQEARWWIRSLAQREETLRRVASAVVDHQSAFFDYGPQAMRPLSMREVAERLGVHESTVSRAVAHKYLASPRGTFELRRFFPAGLATATGGSASSTAIQALIRELIVNETADHVLSDQAIAKRLAAHGIVVARRTVAKYRELLRIPPSHERERATRR